MSVHLRSVENDRPAEAAPTLDEVQSWPATVSVRQGWDMLPITTPMKVRAWPTAEVPQEESGLLAWLTLEWAVVDEWIDAFHANALRA